MIASRAACLSALLTLVAFAACTDAGPAEPDVVSTTTVPETTLPLSLSGALTQPAQPATGPGGSDYSNGDWRMSYGGVGSDAWYVFEPVDPKPRTAPLAIVMHGYFEFDGFGQLHEFIRHTVRSGTIVVYPRWQIGTADPCPGPFDIEPCIDATVNGIRGAIDFLQSDATRVQPELDDASYFGFSFGGIITTNLANRYEGLGLPEPLAVFLDDPHDGGLSGQGEPALDDSLSGIPATTRVICHNGTEGVLAEPDAADSSCNTIFPLLDHIADVDKALVMTVPDDHGEPALRTTHGVCGALPGRADAYDWGFCWKTWDLLRSESDPVVALDDTPANRGNGSWSDGTPIAPLRIRDIAPIRP